MRVRGYAASTPCWYEFVAIDATSAATFYQGLFGWDLVWSDTGNAFTLDGRAVAGLRQSPDGPPAGWMVYLSTEDAEASAARAVAAGGTALLPPTLIGDQGTVALCRDAEGAVFGLWQRGRFSGAELVNEPATVTWAEIGSRDEKAAVAFYGETMGWVERVGELAEGQDYVEWISGGRVVAGMTVMDDRVPAGVPPHWRIILQVDDCAATVAKCLELGGACVMGPIFVGVGDYAQLIDPQGGSFGVVALAPELRSAW
jgi:uncharacterized protein